MKTFSEIRQQLQVFVMILSYFVRCKQLKELFLLNAHADAR